MRQGSAYGVLTAMDGAPIPYRAWGDERSGVAAVLLHGAGPYSRWYDALGGELADAGVGMLCIDQRGFGDTPGPRGHVGRFSRYLDDCAIALSCAAARWPSAHVALIGHSFGGLVALRYCLGRAGRLGPVPSRLVLLAPWIADRLHVSRRLLARGLAEAVLTPAASHPAPLTIYETADPQNASTLAECERDPKWVHALSARWFYTARLAKFGILRDVAKLRVPVLQIEGMNDVLVDPDVNRRLYAAIGSKHKRLVVLPGVYHDSQLQLDLVPLVRPIADFLEAKAAAAIA